MGLAFIGDKVARRLYQGDEGMFSALAYVALPMLGGLLCGMILAGAAAMRDERWSALRWIGFLFNAGPLIYAMIASTR